MKIKDITKEISNGKNLEINLPQYFNEFMTVQNNIAELSMTFHYYTLKDMMMDMDYKKVDGYTEVYDAVENIICQTYGQEADPAVVSENLTKLNTVRDTVIQKMKVLTAYTDAFQIYEYILNRMEGKFGKTTEEVDDHVLAGKIMAYIFSDKDNAAVNARIQEIIGQLPVRMAKTKFMDLVSDGLSIYKGSDKTAVEGFLYLIRTSATLDRPEGYEDSFKSLFEYKKVFESADYKEIDLDKFNSLNDTLKAAVEELENTVRAYYTMQETINALYAVLLTESYANMPGTIDTFRKDVAICKEINLDLNSTDMSDGEISEVITNKLATLEGKQEKLYELRGMLEGVFTDIGQKYEDMVHSLMLEKIFNCLDLSLKLQSNSIFVELDQENDTEFADEIYMKRMEKQLLQEFNDMFVKYPQVLNRAIMANVLSKLPVFFNNQEQVKEYILNSLKGCKDSYEKSACAALVEEIIG